MSLPECIEYMESLPTTDSADLFGMHSNAEKAYLESQAKEFMATVKSTEPRLSSDVHAFRSAAAHLTRSLPLHRNRQAGGPASLSAQPHMTSEPTLPSSAIANQ